jgi:SAM-dependent methyltransferase
MCGDSTEHHKVIGQRLNKSQGYSPRSKFGISVTVKRCKNCGLIYSDPQPRPLSIQDHYGIPPESYWTAVHFQWNESYFLNYINQAKEMINFHQGMKSLDIGAGTGKMLLSLKNAGFDAYGLEPSEPFYKRALEFTGFPVDKLQLSSIEDAVYNENEFDFIIINAVAEHIYTPSATIANAVKWLKPGGVMYVGVPSADYFITNLIDVYFKALGTLYTSHISPMHEPFHLFEFTLKSFQADAKRHNYTIVQSGYDVCPIHFFPKMFHPLLSKFMELTNTGEAVYVWVKKN